LRLESVVRLIGGGDEMATRRHRRRAS
jgi:hypothetical protein